MGFVSDNGGTSMTYSDFAESKPATDETRECIFIESDPTNLFYEWNTDVCSETKSFICQFPCEKIFIYCTKVLLM